MGVDACNNVVETDARFSDSTDVGQHRMLRSSPGECTFQQGVASVVAEGTAEILRHARTKSLDRCADRVGLFSGCNLPREQLPNQGPRSG
jgi:hypothetical protein